MYRFLSFYISVNHEVVVFLKSKCGASDDLINFFKDLYQKIKINEMDVKRSIDTIEDEIWEKSQLVITKLIQEVIKFVQNQFNRLTNDKSKKKEIDTMFSNGDLSNFSVLYFRDKINELIVGKENEEIVRDVIFNISRYIILICATKAASRIKEIYQTSAYIYEKISYKLSGNNSGITDLSYDNIFKRNEYVISEIAKVYNTQSNSVISVRSIDNNNVNPDESETEKDQDSINKRQNEPDHKGGDDDDEKQENSKEKSSEKNEKDKKQKETHDDEEETSNKGGEEDENDEKQENSKEKPSKKSEEVEKQKKKKSKTKTKSPSKKSKRKKRKTRKKTSSTNRNERRRRK